MEIAKTKEYSREKFQTQATIPIAKAAEISYPFQWLLLRPQLHAIEPFQTNQPSRIDNTQRTSTPK